MPVYGSILPIRNKLAYPSGVAPGFDQTHPAAKGCAFSIIGGRTTATNLLTMERGTTSGGTTSEVSGINGIMGPYVAGGGSSEALRWVVRQPGGAQSTITMAMIFISLSLSATDLILVSGTPGSNGWQLGTLTGPTRIQLEGLGGAFPTYAITATLFTNTPYFVAASINGAGQGYIVVTNLQTGQIFSGSPTSSGLPTAAAAETNIGKSFATEFDNSQVAAAMISTPSTLNLQQLLAWAADPWAFWYPRTPIDWVGKVVVAAPTAFIRRNIIRASAKGFR